MRDHKNIKNSISVSMLTSESLVKNKDFAQKRVWVLPVNVHNDLFIIVVVKHTCSHWSSKLDKVNLVHEIIGESVCQHRQRGQLWPAKPLESSLAT